MYNICLFKCGKLFLQSVIIAIAFHTNSISPSTRIFSSLLHTTTSNHDQSSLYRSKASTLRPGRSSSSRHTISACSYHSLRRQPRRCNRIKPLSHPNPPSKLHPNNRIPLPHPSTPPRHHHPNTLTSPPHPRPQHSPPHPQRLRHSGLPPLLQLAERARRPPESLPSGKYPINDSHFTKPTLSFSYPQSNPSHLTTPLPPPSITTNSHSFPPKQEDHQWPHQSFYIVVFRSRIPPTTSRLQLGELDERAHAEAMQSGGLLKYWFGVPDGEGRNLATCK